MQPPDWSPRQCGQRVLTCCLVVLLVGSVFASVAAAEAAIGFRKAEVSATTVTVGESVTVSAEAVNVGDSGGGYTFEFTRNGTGYGNRETFKEMRVTIPANDDRRVSTNVSFDRPGNYEIRVNGKLAGVVTVQSARTRVASVTESQRRIDVRASGVSATEPTEFDIPSSNRTFALRNWSTTTGQDTFQQYLTEYTNRSEVPGTVPAPGQSTLLGVVAIESEDGFEESTMRIGVNDSVLANATVERNEVTVYQRNGDIWEPLPTSVAAGGADRTVYEATATRGTAYAVGQMQPNITIVNTTYVSASSANGARLTLDARLRNDGPVVGTYRGAMRVNGETVNVTTVTVPAGGEGTVSLSYEVTEPGQYRLALNSTTAGSVFIPEQMLAAPQSTGSPSDGTSAAGSNGLGPVDDALPSTIFGIGTLYVVGGLAIALGAFVVIVLLLRRGGGGGGGNRPDSFDPF